MEPLKGWNELEVSALVEYFYENRAELEVGEGGDFKTRIYSDVAVHIAPHRSEGPKKTGSMCKTKWNSVCYHR